MKITIITLFPQMFEGFFFEGIISRAIKNEIISFDIINLRYFADNIHNSVDDTIYGGGPGMLMSVVPLYNAIKFVKQKYKDDEIFTILTSPRGRTLNQNVVMKLNKLNHILILCGHYEGVDERIINFIDEEISVGDYILTSGNISAMVISNCIIRTLPGVLSNKESYLNDTFSIDSMLLEYPQYTTPARFMNMKVPDILLSGDHKKIDDWRLNKSISITKDRRKDIYKKYLLKLKS